MCCLSLECPAMKNFTITKLSFVKKEKEDGKQIAFAEGTKTLAATIPEEKQKPSAGILKKGDVSSVQNGNSFAALAELSDDDSSLASFATLELEPLPVLVSKKQNKSTKKSSGLIGAASHTAFLSPTEQVWVSAFQVIIDHSVSNHLCGFGREAFISYSRSRPGRRVSFLDKNHVLHDLEVLGEGRILIELQGRPVILSNVLHVSSFYKVMISILQHWKTFGCSFQADNSGVNLTLPSFTIHLDDNTPCAVIGNFSRNVIQDEISWHSYDTAGYDDDRSIESFGMVAIGTPSSNPDVSNNSVSMYPVNSSCVGFASEIRRGGLSKSISQSGKFTLIADSGATDSMTCYGKEVYISFKCIHGGYVVLANKQKVPCLGIGKIRILMHGHPVITDKVLHVPALRKMLYSIWQHRRSPGCSFHADNDGIRLDFPTFSILMTQLIV